jgi:glycosyltransferase involved in cell wall biosynthesis
MPDSPIPVLLLVRKLDHGGCERDLTKIAIGLDRSRFTPHVGCFRPEGLRVQELVDGGIPILHLPVTSFRSRGALRGALQLRRYIRDHRIQVVHSFDVPMAMFATPVARLSTARAVLTSQLSYRTLFSPVERRILRVIDRLAHRVVVNCEAMRRHMVEDEKVPASRVFLCYNGVDTRIFFPKKIARGYALGQSALVIGTIANLRPEKGIDVLIRAFAKVRRGPEELRLLIVGSGPCLAELEALAAQIGVREQTTFVPGKPDIVNEMRSIDIFTLPSHSEAFSNSLLEAMACGCAVVGSNIGGTPELIKHRQTGLLFSPGMVDELARQLQHLVNHPEERQQYASAAAVFAAETFSLNRNLERNSFLYQSMVSA